MRLSDGEKAILAGDFGREAKKVLEIWLKVYEINGAEGYVEVDEVMLASTQNMSIGGVMGMEFLTALAEAGVKFKAKTITDPVSIDLEAWERLRIPADYAANQQRSVAALIKMGAVPTWTCTPYLAGSIPSYGRHLAYVETSCVIFANSFFGARTNREMDISALAAAITGRTPRYGMHLPANRAGSLLVTIETGLTSTSDYDALGNYIGKIAGSRIPIFKNMDKKVSPQALMQLGAALATTGAVTLFHAFDVTPDIIVDPHAYGVKNVGEEVVVTADLLKAAYKGMNTTADQNVDFVAVGCPHYTIDKIREIASYLDGKKVKAGVETWVCTSQTVRNLARRSGEIEKIEKTGAKVVIDTCMVLAPVKQMGFRTMATDSAKAQFYVSGFGIGVRFGDTKQCLEAAVTGQWRG
jgi:predicted aconitase